MNTLSKKYTSSFFINPEDYNTFVKRWKKYINSSDGKNLNSADFLYYLVLRGKNYKKAFYPGRKMQDYDYPEGLHKARYSTSVIDEIGKGLLKNDFKNKILKITPNYTNCGYCADAYNDEYIEKFLMEEK